jgi:hypothetical protein
MAGRRGKTGKRKDSVRHEVLLPADFGPLDFTDRRAAPPALSFARRAGAALLSALFLAAGTILSAFAAGERSWPAGLAGLSSIVYGIGWARAAMRGKKRRGARRG